MFDFCLKMWNLLVIASGGVEPEDPVVDPLYKAMDIIVPVALGIILLSGTIYSVVIGLQYSRAETPDDRQKAKKKLVSAIVGFGIVLILLAILYAIRKPIIHMINGD